jgi:hypothetical protein
MAENAIQAMARWFRAREAGTAVVRPDLLAKTATKPTKPPPAKPSRSSSSTTDLRANRNSSNGTGPRIEVHTDDVNPYAAHQPPPVPPRTATDAHHERGFAPCRVCGGATGVKARYFGPWREHGDCVVVAGLEATRVQAACRVLGLGDVDLDDAGLLPVAVPLFSSVHPEPTWVEGERATKPWGHVDRKALVKALSNLPRLRAENGLDVATCVSGRCVWCGVSEALAWHDHDHRWADGTPAPMCGSCSLVYVALSEPVFADDVRVALAAAITGAPPMLGETPPSGLVPYVEVATPEGRARSDAEAWSHLDAEAVKSFRFSTWARYGFRFCPPEHRQEVEAYVAERNAVWAARQAAREAAEQERLDTFGFGARSE